MKTLTLAEQQYRQDLAIQENGLIYIQGRNRETNDVESIGLWDGDDHRVFTIDGEDRTYYGAGNILNIPDISCVVGIDVQQYEVLFSSLTPEILQATRLYDARRAKVQIHRAEFYKNGTLVGTPRRTLKGYISLMNDSNGVENNQANIKATIVTSAWALTKPLTSKYSDASQKTINASDDFNIYTDVTANSDVWWGAKQGNTSEISGNSLTSKAITKLIQKIEG